MLRNLVLIIALVGSYFLIKGWIGAPPLLLRCGLGIITLLVGLGFWKKNTLKYLPQLKNQRSATISDFFYLVTITLLLTLTLVALTAVLKSPSQQWTHASSKAIQHQLKTILKKQPNQSSTTNSDANDDTSESKTDTSHMTESDSGKWLFSENLERQLPKQSDHHPSNHPEVFLKLDRSEDAHFLLHSRIHLRSFSFSRFDGESWSAVPMPLITLSSPIRFHQSDKQKNIPSITQHIYLGANPTGQNVFVALSGVSETNLPTLTRLSNAIFLLPKQTNRAEWGYNYTAKSSPIEFSDIKKEDLHPAKTSPDALSLPSRFPHLSKRIQQTANRIADTGKLSEQLQNIQKYLRDNYQYSLKTTNKGNKNALHNFLFLEKRGYCEHFATATAMLCRAIGVPSRIAYGWSGGELYEHDNMFVFRAKDAHAWTEIKLLGYGWVAFDTTPPDNTAIPETRKAPDNKPTPNPEKTLREQYFNQQTNLPKKTPNTLSTHQQSIIVFILISLILLAGIFYVIRYKNRPPTDHLGRPLTYTPPAYLTHFKQACAAIGHPMPTGKTLRQHLEKLGKLDEPIAPKHFHSDLLHYHYGITYGNLPPDPNKEKQLILAISKWRKNIS